MYEISGSGPQSEAKCKEPDWEAEIAKAQKDLDIIKMFRGALFDFLGVIGKHSFRRDSSSIPELLGTVVLDIVEREKQLAGMMKKLEG